MLFFVNINIARATTLGSEELAFVDLLNDYRKSMRKSELKISKSANEGAKDFAQNASEDPDYSGLGSHTTANGDDPVERGDKNGYYFLTENIGWGYETGQEIFDAWKASEGHKENMITSGGRTVGIARYYNADAIGKEDVNGNTIASPYFWAMVISDEGVERLVGNNLKDSEIYSSDYKKISFTLKKWNKSKKKYKKAKWAEVKIYDKASGRLIDHDIGDKNGKCSVYILGDGKKVTLKVSSFKGNKNAKFQLGDRKIRVKKRTINWTKNLTYTVKIK